MATKSASSSTDETVEPNAGTQQEQPQPKPATDGEHTAAEKAFYAGEFPSSGQTIRFQTVDGETVAMVEKV